jgi:hypothetical protein
MAVDRTYHYYCRVATVVFVMNTLYPLIMKLSEQRLADDWLHSVLHLMSALVGAYASWHAKSVLPAKIFTWAVGGLYLLLGVFGWFTPGLFLGSPFAIPLGVADNVFHLFLGVPAVVISVRDLAMARRLGVPG